MKKSRSLSPGHAAFTYWPSFHTHRLVECTEIATPGNTIYVMIEFHRCMATLKVSPSLRFELKGL
jgi:hypothetical protein